MKPEIKVEIKIKDVKVILSKEEVLKLRDDLNELFPRQSWYYYYPPYSNTWTITYPAASPAVFSAIGTPADTTDGITHTIEV